MRIAVLTLLFLSLSLAACGRTRIIEKPVIHEVVRTEWREIPADLTESCHKQVIPDAMTYGEALEAWAKDRSAIDRCNGKLAGIRSLGSGDDTQ